MARAELARQSLDRPDLERPRRRASRRGGAGNYNYKGRTITLQSTIILHSNCFSTNFVQRENYCPSQLSITKRLQVMAGDVGAPSSFVPTRCMQLSTRVWTRLTHSPTACESL